MSGKTVEEVAREIAVQTAFAMHKLGWVDDPLPEYIVELMTAPIIAALRQREQETAAECERLILAEIVKINLDSNSIEAVERKEGLSLAYQAILRRFPKDQG